MIYAPFFNAVMHWYQFMQCWRIKQRVVAGRQSNTSIQLE
jgi:hypothetical protein